ncbi:ester cyclase [Streptomyces rochei]|uniref:ester cyclase n=1 Tax=Streptomyces rochei TaxID=1928 RepID=UPI003641D339
MPTGTNARLVRRFYQTLEQGDYDTLTGMFHPDFVFYPQIDTPRPGAAGFIDAEKKHVDAFPGIRLTVTDTVAEGDRVGAYVVVEGTQGGDYYGTPPPGAERTCASRCSTCSRSGPERSSRSGPTITRPTSWTSSRPAPLPDGTGPGGAGALPHLP